MRFAALLPFAPWLCTLAAQAPTGPVLPKLLQLGPVPANATAIDLRADGSLAVRAGPALDLAGLDSLLAAAPRELVLAAERTTASAVVEAVLAVATRRNVAQVHFLATLPDGKEGSLTLALPMGPNAPTRLDLRLHRDRPGVPAESCVPLLQRLLRGKNQKADSAPAPLVLGIEIGGAEPFESLLQALAATVHAGCDSAVIRCRLTDSQQRLGQDASLLAIAAASTVPPTAALALDLGPSPALQVLPAERPQARPAVHATTVGLLTRPGGDQAHAVGGGAGGRYGGRAGGRRDQGTGEAIAAGTDWYRRQQRADGSYPDAAGNGDLEATALFALAMLGDGTTLDAGRACDALRAATGWLLAQQRHDGAFASAGPRANRHHALATYALAEAAGLSPSGALLRGSVADALDWLFAQRQPDGGWNDGTRGAPSDTISTASCLLPIASAKFFAFAVASTPSELVAWFDAVAEPNGIHRLTAAAAQGEASEATATAAAVFARYFAGQDPKQVPVLAAGADALLAIADPGDPWCAYWTTYALFQAGGRAWATWSKQLDAAVVKTQVRDGDAKGCWPAAGGNTQLTTSALRVLTLEGYYRYSKLVR